MKLSVIIPNRNDTVMLGITVRSCLEELKAIDNDGEIVIADNSDEDIWQIIKTVNISPINIGYVEEGKIQLFHLTFPSLYAARQAAIERAKGEYVYNMDSHIIVGHNHFIDLVNFMEEMKGTKIGFGFSPIGWISQHELWSRHDIRTDEGTIFGNWGRLYDKPTKILWNFGSRICNTKWFLNTLGGYGFFAKERISWGGGEFYMPLKAALLGYESWAIPCSPQYHIGPFSAEIQRRCGYHYRVYDKSGQGKVGIGVLAAFYALAGDDALEELKRVPQIYTQYGLNLNGDWEYAKELAKEGRKFIKEHQVISYKELLAKRDWTEDWNNWHPQETLKRIVDSSKLEIIN
jgi:glycosyltransferase involved in cell wall biosynthesis